MKTALVTHPEGLLHQTPAKVHEQVGRLDFVLRAIDDLPLARHSAPLAARDVIETLHDPAYVDHVLGSIPEQGFAFLDSDTDDETSLSPTSLNAVLRAVGGAARAVDLVLSGQAPNAFVAMRPPGHHALRDRAMGFCFFGNVALAARHAMERHGLRRVAIVDFDVHHGNGTQALLWDEPRALVVTSQQMPLWPGTGTPEERGAHDNVVNIPLLPGTGGAEMRALYAEQVFPRLRAFDPELILISAGFDCHRDDPLAELNWREADYDWLTRNLCAIANSTCAGRVVSVLEGGYDLPALASSARAHVEALIRAHAD
ncbi:histone deacetylase family protein [Epibacterium sp. Ofav1-8]|uniref:histone deacetylase family protein n=1 Tax=Epibacterium sp. Ofav1-8 TaxID=2917735 RepID=UPI001EF5A9C5|nr:histone deacetylase family protein [Epibacterium sp. Ofav1-8]MCG7623690.1 histone deacetylase family protein [Epibacterium sp. Ofav1-8]